jgi:molybdopterin-guanine dinucleotide biosynthesis protein B
LIITRGVTVSTVKHAHHAFDVDKPGKDSFEHRSAGATKFQPNDTAAGAVEPVRLIY